MIPKSPVVEGVSSDCETVYAKNQPEYLPLPTLRTPDGVVLSRWELSDEELQKVVETRSIYLSLLTFNEPLQPIMLGVEPPPEFEGFGRYGSVTRNFSLNSAMSPAIKPEGFDEALEEVVKTLESPVEWIQVESSNLSAVAYQEDLQLLLVEFKKGEVYKYAGVPKGVFESLMSADSKGRFFAANIKDHFPAERLEVKSEQD